ncbi:MAG: hypothetical protein K5784_06320 [Clostridiales bacterium]|nr:hypothetical protein [Clostridiales bacterium]
MKRILAALLAMLMGAATVDAAGLTVGTDVSKNSITDFYYTVDASYYPPLYQRYRFYVQDGKKWFFHESRQGGGWSQTEEDIVASGTLEITDEIWAEFAACLAGGTVKAREEHLEDGDSGPWTYLYWTGDEGNIQEYSFASYGKQLEFEALCKKLAQDHVLTRFFFGRGGYMMPVYREVVLRNGRYYLMEDDEAVREFPPAFAEELQKLVSEYKLEDWNGFRGSDPRVLDGEHFTLELSFADGDMVRASGENEFPEGYHNAVNAVEDVFRREEMAVIAGEYKCEKPGFGGDFTITLNPDGTYTFYEGALSSYIGSGTWELWYGAVYLNEDPENGHALRFAFGLDDDRLMYIASESSAFPHVKVSDRETFRKQK